MLKTVNPQSMPRHAFRLSLPKVGLEERAAYKKVEFLFSQNKIITVEALVERKAS